MGGGFILLPLFIKFIKLMIVLESDCPTMGRFSLKKNEFSLRPLVYSEILDYVNNKELTDYRSFLKDLKILLKMDQRIAEASILDADYLIYLMKALTISDELKLTLSYHCQACNEVHVFQTDSRNIIFNDLDEQYYRLDFIKIDGTEYRFTPPTIGEFLDKAGDLDRKSESLGLDFIRFASLFPENPLKTTVRLFSEVTGSDAKLIHLLTHIFFNLVEPIKHVCKKKGGETTVGIRLSSVDIFQVLFQSNRVNSNQISFKQVSKDK